MDWRLSFPRERLTQLTAFLLPPVRVQLSRTAYDRLQHTSPREQLLLLLAVYFSPAIALWFEPPGQRWPFGYALVGIAASTVWGGRRAWARWTKWRGRQRKG